MGRRHGHPRDTSGNSKVMLSPLIENHKNNIPNRFFDQRHTLSLVCCLRVSGVSPGSP